MAGPRPVVLGMELRQLDDPVEIAGIELDGPG